MGARRHHWIREANGREWEASLFFSMFHVATCAPHAAEQNTFNHLILLAN